MSSGHFIADGTKLTLPRKLVSLESVKLSGQLR
jgi:hypothetical protein